MRNSNTGSPGRPFRRHSSASPAAADQRKMGRRRRRARTPPKLGPTHHPHPRRVTSEQGRARKLLLKVSDVVDALGIGRTKVFSLLKDKLIPSIKIGRCRRVTADALRDFIKGR